MIGAFTVQLAPALDLGTDRCEVAICEFSCPPPSVGNIKPHVVEGDKNALIYCDLITPQFVSQLKVRCLRTFIHPTAFCNRVFENLYYISAEKRTFRDYYTRIRHCWEPYRLQDQQDTCEGRFTFPMRS